MKKSLIIVFISFLVSTGLCQEKTDSVHASMNQSTLSNTQQDSIDVRALVQSQLEMAREKEKFERENSAAIYTTTGKSESTVTGSLNKIPSLLNPTNLKVSLLVIFSGILFSVIIFRRKKKNKSNDFEKMFKNNINRMRTENLMRKEDNGLIELRNKLIRSEGINLQSISPMAKELQISKGELILAAKIKSFQLAQIGFKNK
jgi:hypothetical protein